MPDTILCARDGAVTTITLNRPEAGNRLTNAMAATLAKMIEDARDSSLIVLTAAGPDFCHGRDMPHPDPAKPPPTPEQLAQWAKDLDHDAFLVREEATLQLVRAGLPAVETCRQVLQKPSAEAGSRALHVLHQLALSNNVDLLDAARSALEDVTRGKTSPLKFRAEEVLAQLVLELDAALLEEGAEIGERLPGGRRHLRCEGSQVTDRCRREAGDTSRRTSPAALFPG